MSDPTNAERQARHRAKQRKQQAALEAELRALRKKAEPAKADGRAGTIVPALSDAVLFQPDAPVGEIARALFATFAGYPGNKGREVARSWLGLIDARARQTIADKPGPVEWSTPAQAKRLVEGRVLRVPGGMGWYVFTDWLREHEQRVIQITVAPIAGGTPLHGAEQMLAALPGVYRIARLNSEGSFGRERGEKRRQVRALMAVTERALEKQALTGGWTSADIVIYDPRIGEASVT